MSDIKCTRFVLIVVVRWTALGVEIGCGICILDIKAQNVCVSPMSVTTHNMQRKQIKVGGCLVKVVPTALFWVVNVIY